ncbi:hypothetical protein YC2023_043914 [Brassica napus]
MEIERRESLSPITRAWVGWGLALSPPFLPQLHRSAVFNELDGGFVVCVCKIQRRWRWGEEEEPEKTEVEFQIQNERKHKSKEEEDENDRVAVGEELRPVRSIALKNQLYAAVGSLLLTTIFFFCIKEVKHNVEEEEDKHGDDVELILLYFVHSDISSLLHQVLAYFLLFKNACAAGGMASEEVGEEVPFILWFSTVFCSLDYFQSSSKVRNFKVMALQSDNITINRVERRAPGEDTEVILYPQGNDVCLFLSGSVSVVPQQDDRADAYTNEVYVLWHDLRSGRRFDTYSAYTNVDEKALTA